MTAEHAWPTALTFTALELCYAVLLFAVFSRLRSGSTSSSSSPASSSASSSSIELGSLLACCALSVICATHSVGQHAWPPAVFASAQCASDSTALLLQLRAQRNQLKHGPASTWRAVLSSVAGWLAVAFCTDQFAIRVLLGSVAGVRAVWVVVGYVGRGEECAVDEVGLLWASSSSSSGTRTVAEDDDDGNTVYLAFPDGDDEDVERGRFNALQEEEEVDGGMSQSLMEFGPPSFVNDDHTPSSSHPPLQRSSSSVLRNNASPDLILSVPSNVTWGVLGGDRTPPPPSSRPPPTKPSASSQCCPLLPSAVALIGVRQVFTPGGIPLNVYVLRLGGTRTGGGRTRVCVHRYGDFRALHKRFIARAVPAATTTTVTTTTTIPPFPVRRLVRKLLPQVLGGFYHEDERDYINRRALDLDRWIQAVLRYFQQREENEGGGECSAVMAAARLALCEFLRPLGQEDADNDDVDDNEELVIAHAVHYFSTLNMTT